MTTLMVAPCSHDAAKYAVMNWHYSRAMPSGKLVKFGVWEDEAFVGVVLYGRGATPQLGSPYGLDQIEVCELVRVALRTGHASPTSQVVSRTIQSMRQQSPGLRLIVSFADTAQGHHGGIYQAMNWVYAGQSMHHRIMLNGKLIHPRSLGAKYGVGGQSIPWLRANVDPNAERVDVPGKHRYLYPLDRNMRRRIEPLRLPYPHAVEGSEVSRGTSGAEGQVRSLPTAQSRRITNPG